MLEVVSLLGPSGSGKSTLAEALVPRLADRGITADVIKKDEALKAIGRERYGDDDQSAGYSIAGFLRHGQIPSHELHGWMNQQVKASLAAGHLAILEGGTRTRTAQAETLEGLELDHDGLRIFMLDLPFRDVIGRIRQRRKESGRYDDFLPVASAKLLGQYRGMQSADAVQPIDPDVTVLDARLSVDVLATRAANHILVLRPE